jgi:hypothetical protein
LEEYIRIPRKKNQKKGMIEKKQVAGDVVQRGHACAPREIE